MLKCRKNVLFVFYILFDHCRSIIDRHPGKRRSCPESQPAEEGTEQPLLVSQTKAGFPDDPLYKDHQS